MESKINRMYNLLKKNKKIKKTNQKRAEHRESNSS